MVCLHTATVIPAWYAFLEIKCRIIYVKKNKQKTPKKQLTKLNLSDTQTLQSRLFTAIALWFTVECVVAVCPLCGL